MSDGQKYCSRCEVEKPLEEFHNAPRGKFKKASMCKSCKAEWVVEDREKNRSKYNKRSRDWYKKNPDAIKRIRLKSRDEHNSRNRKRAKEAYNLDVIAAREKLREYRSLNADSVRRWCRDANRKRYSNPKFRVENSIRSGIWSHVSRQKKKSKKTFEILGYTPEELCSHLEGQFTHGMTWENYGEWHIDHIVPLAAFNYETVDDIDFGRAWAIENLRPLWASENMKKGAKIDYPFQPSLTGLGVGSNERNV